jgi:hypothetical protein
MPTLKIASWNVKLFGQLLAKDEAGTLSQREAARLAAIAQQMAAIDADIWCIIEGPKPDQLVRFGKVTLGGAWQAITRPAGDPYHMGSGPGGKPQNILFMARPAIAAACRIDPVARWRALTRDASRRAFETEGEAFKTAAAMLHDASWSVSHPFLAPANQPWPQNLIVGRHRHHRHPQVLSFQLRDAASGETTRVELIGLHLKSKINRTTWTGTVEGSPAHVREAIEARIKLTTEAMNVRYYLNARFDQNPDAAIMLMGDLNDGPGRDLWEEIFLFHDLVGNLQGDIFAASRFLNHALFDFPGELRWTAEFDDSYNPGRTIRPLIDHILFTQRFVRRDMRKHLWVEPFAGRVEHEVHGLINASLHPSQPTSDHVPVSCVVTLAPGLGFEPSPV